MAHTLRALLPSISYVPLSSLQVQAGVTAVGQDEIKFLDLNTELWSSKSAPSKPTGRLAWPFSITLPTDATVSERGKKQHSQRYPLPPSFSERASPAYIDYKLVVTVRRSSFRVNQTYCSRSF